MKRLSSHEHLVKISDSFPRLGINHCCIDAENLRRMIITLLWRDIDFPRNSSFFHQKEKDMQVSLCIMPLTLMLLVANLFHTKWCKKNKNDWNPGTWILSWRYSVRAIQWIPTWQGLDSLKKIFAYLCFDGLSLRIKGLTYSCLEVPW